MSFSNITPKTIELTYYRGEFLDKEYKVTLSFEHITSIEEFEDSEKYPNISDVCVLNTYEDTYIVKIAYKKLVHIWHCYLYSNEVNNLLVYRN